jgi:hypothetical protein
MKKKFLWLIVSVILLILVLVVSLPVKTRAAVCTPKDGTGSCYGECCITLLSGGCVAGPCDKIYK